MDRWDFIAISNHRSFLRDTSRPTRNATASSHAHRGPTIFFRFGLVKKQSADHRQYAPLGSWKDPRATNGLVRTRATLLRIDVASPEGSS